MQNIKSTVLPMYYHMEHSDRPRTGKGTRSYTIASLRLDVEAAREGRTWLLLPEGFRDQAAGHEYPLPGRRDELQILSSVYFPSEKTDAGCIYLRRVVAKLKRKDRNRQSAVLDYEAKANQIRKNTSILKKTIHEAAQEAKQVVEEVRKEAALAIASLNDLFELGRKGIEAQMKAHLEHKELHGEEIDARAFRECFRMVTQAVKGLGLPSDQRRSAEEAVQKEVAESLRATQEALELAPGQGNEVEH
jgi:hypothetical protein